MDTIFTVKKQHLERFSPDEAVSFFRELLWAEATNIGIGKNLIDVPGAITVADGGIDAQVSDSTASGGQGIIKYGLTRYQIKTGNFAINATRIKEILFAESAGELKPRIKTCLDNDGTLVVVLFGWDNPDRTDDQLVKEFIDVLVSVNPKYGSAKIEVWRQNTLIGFLKKFPSLALLANGNSSARFQTHKSWSLDAEMKKPYKAGPEQIDTIENLNENLGKVGELVHIRVFGEPGIGKTRIVLEATKTPDVKPLIIYCDTAGKFIGSDLMNEILRDDNDFSCILVVDECTSNSSAYIWNKLQERGSRIKLVSIYTEHDDTVGIVRYLNAPALGPKLIRDIIQEYGVPKDQADRWSDICSGSPRVAHVIGLNLKNNPEDLLKSPDTVQIWERYIAAGDEPNSEQVAQRRFVLRYLALFKRFGFDKTVIDESRSIAKLIETANPQISWARFQEIIKELRERRILQGETTLYITPKALHIKLWIDWWNTYGAGFILADFCQDLPSKLVEWFYDMFRYAAHSEVANQVVKELLEKGGPFEKEDQLRTELGADFFLALSEANPKAALGYLTRTIGTQSRNALLSFKTGRRETVWALEKIVVWGELFTEGTRLLLALGEAENETWSNNASGIFIDLFAPRLALTETSPAERFPILQEAINSDSSERRDLALKACNKALESFHFSRSIGPEHQGLKTEPILWAPTIWQELFDAYQRVWVLVFEKLGSLSSGEREKAANILLNNVRGLVRFKSLSDLVIDTMKQMVVAEHADKRKVLGVIVKTLHYDHKKIDSSIRKRLEELRDELTGSDFPSLLKRYVGMDLLVDKFDKDGNQIDQTQDQIDHLAKTVIEDKEILYPELTWLSTTDASNGYRFGYALAKRDNGLSLLPQLIESQKQATKKSSPFFLSGYLKFVFEKHEEQWETILDKIAVDKDLRALLAELTWRSGISDNALLRILQLSKEEVIEPEHFRIFSYGNVTRDVSENVINKLIEFLLENEEIDSISIALDIYQAYYIRKEPRDLPKALTFQLLTHKKLIENNGINRAQMDDYNWTEIAKVFIKQYPKQSLRLADSMLEYFGEKGTIFEGYHSITSELLYKATSLYPGEVWELVKKRIGHHDSRAFHIRNWLQGGEFFIGGEEGALSMMPADKVWQWVDEDIEERAYLIANFVPKKLFRDEKKICLAREVLVRYGGSEDVRRSLMANFATEGWSGPESLHYQEKKQKLLSFKKEETEKNVIKWIDEYVATLGQHIEQARMREERQGY